MWLIRFLIYNGIGQNLTASAILGVPALMHIHRLLERHHQERLSALHRFHNDEMRALGKVHLNLLRARHNVPPEDSSD